jgi:hypothetical protein
MPPRTAYEEAQSKWPAQALSVAILMTYVSGYLITSTYLNTFQISTDASEFFKARYLYVGFLFVLYLSTIVLLVSALRTSLVYLKQKLRRHGQHLAPTSNLMRAHFARLWTWCALLLGGTVAAQITLLRPEHMRGYIFSSCGLLATFMFYQLSYFRSHLDNGWDGVGPILSLRIRCVVFMGLFSCISGVIFLSPYFTPAAYLAAVDTLSKIQLRSWSWRFIVFALLSVAFISAIPIFYRDTKILKIYLRVREGKAPYQRRWTQYFTELHGWFALLGAVCIFSPLALTFMRPWVCWLYLQSVGLLLSTAALLSVAINAWRSRIERKLLNERLSTTDEWMYWIIRVSILIVLYVGTVLGYAHFIFPRIPVEKSGGDYTTASIVTVHLRRSDGSACGPNKECSGLVVIEETPDVVYLAQVDDTGTHETQMKSHCGPLIWKRGLVQDGGPYRPRLIEISQRQIISVEETGSVQEFCRTH